MKLKTDMIEKRQFLFTVVCFLQCVTVHISIMMNSSVKSSWLVLLVASLTGVISALIIGGLNKIYGNKGLEVIAEKSLGKFLGKTVSAFYILFFFWKFCDTVFEFSSFVNDSILPKTPEWVILSLIIAVCVFAVNFGIAVVSGTGFLLTLTVFIITVGSALLLIPKYELSNFLPQFSDGFGNYAEGFAVSVVEPFGEIIVFLTVIPYVKNLKDSGKLVKLLLCAVALGTVTFLINVIRDTGTLGVLVKYFIFPTFESIRMIKIGEIFSRVEIFYAGILMMLAFFKASIWLFAACEMLKGFVGERINRPVSAGIAAFALTLTGNKMILDSIHENMTMNLTINIIFEYLIPVLFLIIGSVLCIAGKVKNTASA